MSGFKQRLYRSTMKCCICEIEKLRREFPRETLSPQCDHAPLYCLRCAVSAAEDTNLCPFKDCGLEADSEKLEYCQRLLAFLFPELEPSDHDIDENCEDEIFISTLDGERTAIPFSPKMYVINLKEKVKEKLQVETNKQKLVYHDTQLEVYKDSGDMMMLGDYNITKGATIHLMVLLYAIPEHLDHVIFDLSWGYPHTGRDFLDATCLIFSHSSHKGTVNYDKKSWPAMNETVKHSGDGMDDSNRRGYHTIDIFLKKLPTDTTHLLFCLSVWSSPSIAHFPSPILRFYDAANKSKDLCNTSLSNASDSEAVIMCYVARKANKKGWEIFESGQLSNGNAMNYEPLYETAKGIIAGRFPAKSSKGVVKSITVAPVSASRSVGSSGPRIVEIVFCFDTTGSMYGCLQEVKKKVKEIISRLLREMPNLRISVFAHGDHDCPLPYVTTFIDFTSNVTRLCNFVTNVERTPGGDAECYEFALFEMRRRLTWSKGSNKSIVMIGDAYPHLVGDPVNKANVDWKAEAKGLFKDKGVRIYAVQCQTGMTGSTSNAFWKELAVLGHGKRLLLNNFNMIVDLLLAICYREAAPSRLRKFEKEVRERGSGSSMSSLFDELN